MNETREDMKRIKANNKKIVLFSLTIQNRIKKYLTDKDQLDEDIRKCRADIQKAEQTKDYELMLALKYEYHC